MTTLTRADREHSVSTLELFFDLVFVFAITQVTAYIAADPTWTGVLQGVLLLCLIYWSWIAYSWLGTSAAVETRLVTAAFLVAMAGMFIVAILLPQWFAGGTWAVVAVAGYFVVRAIHIALFYLLGAQSPELRRATLRLGVSAGAAVVLLLAGAIVGGTAEVVLVVLAVLIDPIGVFIGPSEGWYLSPDHFAERHGLLIIIAIGESLIALGLTVSGADPDVGLIVMSLVGVLLAALVYVLYFRRTANGRTVALAAQTGGAQARFGRDVFSYGHVLLIAGIISLALALKKIAGAVADDGLDAQLHGIAGPAVIAAGALIIGGTLLLRLRAGLGISGWLVVGLAISVTAGVLALYLPAIAVLAVLTVGFMCAVAPAATAELRPLP